MSLFSKLFGGSGTPKGPPPVTYNGFNIRPEPIKEPNGYRIAAWIEKEVDGEVKTHHLIRADTYGSQDTAVEASLSKARQTIDQMGETLFR